MSSDKPARKTYHIKGHFRILNFTLTGKPIYVTHGVYKKLLTEAQGRLELAGNPVAIDINFNIEFEQMAFWRGDVVQLVRELDNYPVRGLAPGIVTVKGVRSPFMFYGNCWLMLAGAQIVGDDLTLTDEDLAHREEDGQKRFTTAIDKMEKNAAYDQPGVVKKRVSDSNNYRERLRMPKK